MKGKKAWQYILGEPSILLKDRKSFEKYKVTLDLSLVELGEITDALGHEVGLLNSLKIDNPLKRKFDWQLMKRLLKIKINLMNQAIEEEKRK